MQPNLDTDCLRTLVAFAETGTFARAAERVGRTPAAVSQQMERLAVQVRAALFLRDGRRVVLSAEGERLLAYARRLLTLNDEAVEALAAPSLSGLVRFGTTQDLAESLLPEALARFAQAHPGCLLDVRVGLSGEVTELWRSGDLDLALTRPEAHDGTTDDVYRIGSRWIAAPALLDRWNGDGELPLVTFPHPCFFRSLAISELDRAGVPWRIVATSPGISGVLALVRAGLGATVRLGLNVGEGLVEASQAGLPPLPPIAFRFLGGGEGSLPAARRLRGLLYEALVAHPDVVLDGAIP